jgi:hypothetical protein
VVAPLEMKEGTTLGARAQSAIQRVAVFFKPHLATFKFFNFTGQRSKAHSNFTDIECPITRNANSVTNVFGDQ